MTISLLAIFPELVRVRRFQSPTPPPVAAPAVARSQVQQKQHIASTLSSTVALLFRSPILTQFCRREVDAVADADISGGALHKKIARPTILASPATCTPSLASLPQSPVNRQNARPISCRLKQHCHIGIRCTKTSPLFQTSPAGRRGRKREQENI